MKQLRLLLLLAFVALGLGITQAQQSTTPPSGNPQSPASMAIPQLQPSPVRILTPTPGQTLSTNYAQLHFELARPAPSGEPIFLVQLDSNDPISTSDTDYTFADLPPGSHTVRVTLVDANNSPIEGATATVQFSVPSVLPTHVKGSSGGFQRGHANIVGAAPSAPIPPELRDAGDITFPLKGSPLPLLSLIGFILLIAAAVHALRAPKNAARRAAL